MPTIDTKPFKNYCTKCVKDTNHKELYSVRKVGESDYAVYWQRLYMVVECLGCENISFREELWDEESRDTETGEIEIDISTYPKALKNKKELNDTYLLPPRIRIAYQESLNAFKNNCNLLAGVGFRAVIEAVCKDKKIDGREIKSKIDNLFKKGFISEHEADRLHPVRFLGNDSVHEIEVPTEEQLHSCLIIIEHLLTNIYLLDKILANTIDKMIVKYYDFEELLDFHVANLDKGVEKNLKEILGKHIRRISSENLKKFEMELQVKIREEKYKELTLVKVSENEVDIQNYIVVNEKDTDFPKRRMRFLSDYLNGDI